MDEAWRKEQERAVYNREVNLDRPAFGSYWDPELWRAMFAAEFDRDFATVADQHLRGRKTLVLGAGCTDVAAVHPYASDIVALNISEQAIQEVVQAYPEVRAVVGDAEQLELSEPFEALYCHAILHHLHPFDEIVDGLADALTPGGILFIGSEPSLYNPFAAAGRVLIPSQSHTPGERPFVFSQMQRRLERQFEPLFVQHYFLLAHIWPYLARKSPALRPLCRVMLQGSLRAERLIRHASWMRDFYWIVMAVYRKR